MATDVKSPEERNTSEGLRGFLEREVVARYPSANERLRAQVTGLLKILDLSSGKFCFVDFIGQDAKLIDIETRAPDCTLECSGRHLEQIADGDLNPQLAMLAGKVKVSGRTALGIYFFNLIVRQ